MEVTTFEEVTFIFIVFLLSQVDLLL